VTTGTALLLADLNGVVVFAASGASAAVVKRFDLLRRGLVGFVAALPQLARLRRTVLVLDAAGLGLFTVTGTVKALAAGVPGARRLPHRHADRESATADRTGTLEEEEYLGLPGLLTADQVELLLTRRRADHRAHQRQRTREEPHPAATAPPMSTAQRRVALRRQLNALVAAHHHRTGLPHGKIHAELRRRCDGPPSAQATIEQLEERIATVQTL
jgi:hypothetical protein